MHANRTARWQAALAGIVLLAALVAVLPAQQNRLVLGRLSTGSTAAFVRSGSSAWGIEVTGGDSPRVSDAQPARFEVFGTEQDIRQVAAGYRVVDTTGGVVVARAEVAAGAGVTFQVEDRWSNRWPGDVGSPESRGARRRRRWILLRRDVDD